LRSTAMTKINLTKIFCSLYFHDFMIRCITKLEADTGMRDAAVDAATERCQLKDGA